MSISATHDLKTKTKKPYKVLCFLGKAPKSWGKDVKNESFDW